MERIHLKPLVTLVGRGGGGRRVLFDGEVREVRVSLSLYIYIERIYEISNPQLSRKQSGLRPGQSLSQADLEKFQTLGISL